jgi:hypothetical protein
MSRPGRHFVHVGDTFKGRCGPVQAVYTRHGTRWTTLGRMCLRCHAFWPASVPERLREPGEIDVEERTGTLTRMVDQPPAGQRLS